MNLVDFFNWTAALKDLATAFNIIESKNFAITLSIGTGTAANRGNYTVGVVYFEDAMKLTIPFYDPLNQRPVMLILIDMSDNASELSLWAFRLVTHADHVSLKIGIVRVHHFVGSNLSKFLKFVASDGLQEGDGSVHQFLKITC
jgi:hypothetical protein